MHKVFVAFATVAMVCAGLASATPPAFAEVTLDGIVRTLATDTVSPLDEASAGPHHFTGRSRDIYKQILEVGTRSYVLRGTQAPSNSRVRVSGTVNGDDFQAANVTVLGAEPRAFATTGTTRVLVMLAHWTAPDSVTQASATAQMFSDSNGWFRDASYNALGQSGDVTPWMQIAGPTSNRCYGDHLSVMAQAKAGATNLGFALASYDNFVVYFPDARGLPGSDCQGYAGWAYIGAAGTWLNGFMDRRITVHEQGHNYGLSHSHSHLCTDVLSGSCVFREYGDDFDAMGGAAHVGHFSGPQKSLLGWMGPRTVDLSAGGSTTLVPMASDSSSPHAAVIATSQREYWLEYRQPIDYDAALPAPAMDGVQVRMRPGSQADDGPALLDMRPGATPSTLDATMLSGQSWMSPDGIAITVGAVTAAGAQIQVVGVGARYHPLTPSRILDTRSGLGAPTKLGPGQRADVQVTGRGGVPATGVSAVLLNVTAVLPTAQSYLTAWPAYESRPLASNLNYAAGDIVPNLVMVKLGAWGMVSLYNHMGSVDVVADVAGYYGDSAAPATGSLYNPLLPARILDTRSGVGAPQAKVGAGASVDLQVTGHGGVPAGASAVVLNVTAVLPSAGSFLTAWPSGETRPVASNLNYGAGDIVPNLVVVKVGAGGKVSLYNQAGSVDVAADVAGYYGDGAAPSGVRFNPVSPGRILDTRSGLGAPTKVGPNASVEVQVTGLGGVPAGASAVVLNVTAVLPSAGSFLTAWPSGDARPVASNLNYRAGDIVPNLVVAKVGAGGKVSFYNQAGSVDLVADVAGWFTSA